jgi:hypothetical protein
VDGNFTAQHMKMRRPEDDIPLSDGLGYMVANEPYQKHVAQAANNEEVCIIRPSGHDSHIHVPLASHRGRHARIIGLSMMPIPKKLTCVPLVWVLQPVLVMVALFPILWLIFTRENSKFISHICIYNLLIFGSGLKAKKCRLLHLSGNLL